MDEERLWGILRWVRDGIWLLVIILALWFGFRLLRM